MPCWMKLRAKWCETITGANEVLSMLDDYEGLWRTLGGVVS